MNVGGGSVYTCLVNSCVVLYSAQHSILPSLQLFYKITKFDIVCDENG